jgi:membrane protease YdiL (CAAX protease family)
MTNSSTKSLGPYVFGDIADGVLLLSYDGTIAYMNKSAQSILNIASTQLGCSLPGIWLQQEDSRNDDLCQSILDALYDKQTKITKTVNFYTPNNDKRTLQIKSSYWKDPEPEGSDGVLLILQDVTEEERLKKEKEDAILIFSFFLTAIGIWTLFYAGLTQFQIEIPLFCMTYILLGLGAVLAWLIIWKTDLTIYDIGLSFRNIRKPVLVNVTFSLIACLVLIAAKAILVMSGSDFFPEGQPFFDFQFTLGMKLYPLSVLLQEILSQSIIHECLMRILKGKNSRIHAILLSSVLFTALHIHRGFGFMIGSLLLGCVIGILYRKQRTVWGLCITHYSVSMMAFFLNWL